MIYSKPTLTEYIIAKLITVSIIVTVIYSLILYQIPKEYHTIPLHISLFLFALSFIVIYVYIGAKKVDEQLINILRKIKKKDKKKQKQTAKIKLKNRQRSDMLSAIAHEFRNPIAAIMGYAQTLNEDEDIPVQLRKRFLTKVYNNGEKIEELLSRLLLWNRFESGEQDLQLSKFDIQPLIQEVALNLEDRYKNRTITVDNTSLNIKADRALMEIVIKNLIENALKYSKEEVEVKIDEKKISVIDKGVGISAKNIEKVTKKFFRTDEHSWDNSMGLGLAIVKQILKLHNSAIIIESQEHVGSTFYFYIH